MRADVAVPCITGVTCVIASVTTLSFTVMTLTYSARAALFAMVRVLVIKSICVSLHVNSSATCLHKGGVSELLCSPRYSQQSLPS